MPLSFQEFMTKRGQREQNSTNRQNSSAFGLGPWNPPTSCPMLNMPDRLMLSPWVRLNRSVFQAVSLSPDQVWA